MESAPAGIEIEHPDCLKEALSGPWLACGVRGKLVESGQAEVGGGAAGRTIPFLPSAARGQELRSWCPSLTVG